MQVTKNQQKFPTATFNKIHMYARLHVYVSWMFHDRCRIFRKKIEAKIVRTILPKSVEYEIRLCTSSVC